MATDRLHRNIQALNALTRNKRAWRNNLIQKADVDLILCIGDCAHNILKGNVPLSVDEYRTLEKYKYALADLKDENNSIKRKKNILINQKGGFLPLLLTPILSIAGSLLADTLSNKI